jgi:hypothetical protein
MAIKNQALTVSIWVLDTANNIGLSGASSSLALKGIGDGSEYSLGVTATEVNANTLPGLYSVSLPASATNFNFVTIGGISTSANTTVVPTSFATERGYLDAISADTNEIQNVSASVINYGDNNWATTSQLLTSASQILTNVQNVSAAVNLTQVNGVAVTISDFKNTDLELYTNAVSAISGTSISASVDSDAVAAALLSATIDGSKTFEDVMEILLSMASGKIVRTNNVFQFYKQDDSTVLFTITSEKTGRTKS